jgi:glycosyltransferase involved in cell wall biosynthesis
MKILRVIDTLDPRTGGPISGVRALSPVLSALGHETVIVTLDAPGTVADTIAGARVVALGPARGSYRFAPALRAWLDRELPNFDAVFVHGLWQYPGRAVRAAALAHGIPYFVYPHGMLDPWFRSAYPAKHFKKWIYWQLIERRVLANAAAVLFTCEEERRLARTSFSPYHCVERVVNYGTAGAPPEIAPQRQAWSERCPEVADRAYYLFLGRIHPKKGVDLLLHAYRTLAKKNPNVPALVIAGPGGDVAFMAQLKALCTDLPPGAKVVWPGLLEGNSKWGALRAAEAFVLPSHQENFGLAVVEALSVGTPVLLSHQINIWREIVDDGAGLAREDTVQGTTELLRSWQAASPEQRREFRERAAACYDRRFTIEAVANSFIATVEPLLSDRMARSLCS